MRVSELLNVLVVTSCLVRECNDAQLCFVTLGPALALKSLLQ